MYIIWIILSALVLSSPLPLNANRVGRRSICQRRRPSKNASYRRGPFWVPFLILAQHRHEQGLLGLVRKVPQFRREDGPPPRLRGRRRGDARETKTRPTGSAVRSSK